ncbi:MAG: CDC48 family AAA ATPase [Candidatus Aenigmarchaeota archaeon]|nr:CDC48 family AAA ATPase [Candidatus Aenigmarchaeota archaeon]
MTEIKLKVGELTQRDEYGKGIARIDSKDMTKLGIKEGDIIDINGKTGVVAIRAYPVDIGKGIIRIDGLVRKNAQSPIGEMVTIKKAEIKDAKKIILAPAEKNISMHIAPNLIKQNIYMRPMRKGDVIIPNMVFKREHDEEDEAPVDPFADMPPIIKSMLGAMGSPMNRGEVFFSGQTKLAVVKTVPDGIVQITDDTEIEMNSEAVEISEMKMPSVTYEDIGGLKEVVPKIREMIEVPLRHPEVFERLGVEPPKGVLLYGPPGSGKTLLAKAVANESGAHFISVAGPEIMSKWYGGSEENLRKIFEEADKNAPTIIFIDEIDAIAPKREDVSGEVERRVVSQLLTLMDGLKNRGKIIVIAATNRPNAIDQALRRGGRFDREIEIGVPDKQARKEILQIHTRNMPMEKEISIEELSDKTYGYVGADLAALAKESAMSALRRVLPEISELKENEPIPKEVVKKLRVTKEDFDYALHMVQPSAMREVMIEVPKVKWADVGGLEEVKESLKEAVEWPIKHPDSFERLGIKAPRGILMYGPPGCGKTMIAKAVANEANANFISIKGPEVFSKWVGESEKQIRDVFRRARQVAPSIIFIDEIDSVTPKRGSSDGSHVTEQVVSQLLTEMSGLEDLKGVVVLAATNRPDIVDPALLRPGRFDKMIYVPAPDEKTRLEILKVHTKNMPLKGVDIKKIATKTEGYSGADLEALVREAALISLREDIKSKEVTNKHLESAFKKIKPSITDDMFKKYQKVVEELKKTKLEEESKASRYIG